MGLALHVGAATFPLGSPAFLKAFFSTVYVRLEAEDWGSRFPWLMNGLYGGSLTAAGCPGVLQELAEIRLGLAGWAPEKVVWDFENRAVVPPWGATVGPAITSLANYFVTSDGQDLLTVLERALLQAQASGSGVRIE